MEPAVIECLFDNSIVETTCMSDKLLLKELSRYQLGTFADVIYRNALLHPDREAFVCGSRRVTFGQFNKQANRLIQALAALGAKKGDVIGILAWNSMAYCDVFGAAMKAGLVLAHFNPRLRPNELKALITDSQAGYLFIGPELVETVLQIKDELPEKMALIHLGNDVEAFQSYRDLVKDYPDREPPSRVCEDDAVTIFYTSGTTGNPRGAVYTHRQKLQNAVVKALDIGAGLEDRNLVALPMFHIGGDSHIWPFFITGACNIILPSPTFDPQTTLETVQNEKITDLQIVPTQLVAMLNLPDIKDFRLESLKRIWYAASPMPTQVLKKGLAVFGQKFIQGYGQTESGPHTTVLPKSFHTVSDEKSADFDLLASCGQPCLGVHMRIVDENDHDLPSGQIGELIVSSDRIMQGFWNKPQDTREVLKGGWLRTGDMGYYDDNGFIYIADRKKDMIVTGGENVFPREVEEVLYRHPSVSEAAVIGIPDPYWVEKVHALVVLNAGADIDEQTLIDFVKQQIAGYKVPKGIEFVDSLPKNPQGKVLKKELRLKYRRNE